jgi:hypothetical protein
MQKEGQKTVETPVEARAGFLDRPALVVLSVSRAQKNSNLQVRRAPDYA